MAEKLSKTVFVGVSGGVDSSVSAALLKDQGYNVVGVFIRTWQPDFIECTWRSERRDAMRVCAHLGIPFLECDAEEAYKRGVADYMIEEYKKGNTPNPDVMCNREVKFGVFWDFAKSNGADYIATGHYAMVVSESKNSFLKATGGGVPLQAQASNGVKELEEKLFLLKRSPDQSKDQSYFLWTLTQTDLSHTLFPIGHMQKTEVRKLAEKYKLPTATKKDSQGVCFLGPLDMKEFLMHYIEPKHGDVLDKDGNVIGHHDGAVFLTLGERHGFTIVAKGSEDKAYYVVYKDIKNNTITVSSTSAIADIDYIQKKSFELKNTNWISGVPNKDKMYTAQIRYHGEQFECRIDESSIIFTTPVLVSPGQSIVIYDGHVCMGGGVVV
jgi:tRNA-specific 2-thiouridylase